MMKKMFLCLALLGATLHAGAQGERGSWTIVPKLGLNLATTTTPDLYYVAMGTDSRRPDPTRRLGLVVGAEAEYQQLEQASWSVGLLYSQQGRSYDNADMVPLGWRDVELKLHYLCVPVMANVYVARGLALKVGGQLGALVYKHQREEAEGPAGTWTVEEGSTWHRWWDFSVALGASYAIADRWQVDLRYNIGVNDISKVSLAERNRVLQLTLGYRFEL